MKFLLALLLAFALTASAYAAAVQTRSCCPGDDCSVVQCMDMGCLPATSPMMSLDLPALPHHEAVRDAPIDVAYYLPNRYKEIWTPPD